MKDPVTEEKITPFLETKWAGRHLVCFVETDSTNVRIRQLSREGAPHGTVAVAGAQTEGRGRRGRIWQSPPDSGIYMSILLRPDIDPDRAPMLTLAAACSTAGALDRWKKGASVQIKWPNDIIINGRKVAGILTEMNVRGGRIDYVAVGIGINVNRREFPEELQDKATSLYLEWGCPVQRAYVVASVINHLEADYETFMKTRDLSGLKEFYEGILVNKDRDVVICREQGSYPAHALGITKTGELLVRRAEGDLEAVFAGEVSVRGVYGYV